MNIRKEEITTEYILGHWKQGKSTLDWRPLTLKEKRQWLKACLSWTGLPEEKIKSFDYVLEGSQVNIALDFFCLLGETFFGYRGYFGQDAYGFNDCFSEIFVKTKNKEAIEKGARVIFKSSEQIRAVLEDSFQYVIDSFCDYGFEVELE